MKYFQHLKFHKFNGRNIENYFNVQNGYPIIAVAVFFQVYRHSYQNGVFEIEHQKQYRKIDYYF